MQDHLAACRECQLWEREERAVSRLLAERLVRHPAPPHLRPEILRSSAPRGRYSWWAVPVAALATAMVMVLLLLPRLPRSTSGDTLQPFIRAVYSQHARSLLWGEPRPQAVLEDLPRLMVETGIGLSWVFMGDEDLKLLGVEPVILQGQRGLAFHYSDPDDHMITYVAVPGQGLSVPERNRVQVDRFRPMLARFDGFSLFVWKQGNLACFLISDLVSQSDLERFREYFLKIRSTTEPFSIY